MKVYENLRNILANHPKPKKEIMIDDFSGFILLDKKQNPKVAQHIKNECRWALRKYTTIHPEEPLSHITPHDYLHTFCTNMANAGMEVKALQYLICHSDVGVTLNVYTHTSYDKVPEQMAKFLPFEAFSERKSV